MYPSNFFKKVNDNPLAFSDGHRLGTQRFSDVDASPVNTFTTTKKKWRRETPTHNPGSKKRP